MYWLEFGLIKHQIYLVGTRLQFSLTQETVLFPPRLTFVTCPSLPSCCSLVPTRSLSEWTTSVTLTELNVHEFHVTALGSRSNNNMSSINAIACSLDIRISDAGGFM